MNLRDFFIDKAKEQVYNIHMKNYHTHTKRCNHAYGEDRDYVEAAIKSKIEELGFSDHAPMLFEGDYISGFRMLPIDTLNYVNSVRALQKEYKDKISIRLGFEVEYYPKLFKKELEYLKSFDYDYLILGQHYTDNEYEPYAHYSGRKTNSIAILEKYINQALEGLSTGEFAYIAHPDLINFTGKKEIYREKMTEFCKEIKKLDIPVEFNMLGYSQKRNYPNKSFWEIVSEVGNKVIIGFDAHSPEMLKNKKTYNDMVKYLNKLNISPTDSIELKK